MCDSSLIEWWLDNRYVWFGATEKDDIYITEQYGDLLDDHDIDYTSITNMLHHIILFDQITWHVDRVRKTKTQKKFAPTAIRLCKMIIDEQLYTPLTPIERCFMLMPLRHSDHEDQLIALSYIKLFRQNNTDPDYARFHKTTLVKLSKLSIPDKKESNLTSIMHFVDNIICPSSEYNQMFKDNYEIPRSLAKTITSLITEKKVVVSLSGGSDSMLCAYLLKKLGYDVTALMINYNNRVDEQKKEVEMVSFWCKSMGIDLYVRIITEISRSRDNDRNMYEQVTNLYRFDAYKYFRNPVIFGHNDDDRYENINTNIKKGINYDNLCGMKSISTINGVKVYRPILHIDKTEIIRICNKANIPFVYDSTPYWSDRGTMRDKLIPVQKELGMKKGYYQLADHLSEMDSIIDTLVDMVNIDLSIDTEKYSIIVVENPHRFVFSLWKKIFRKLVSFGCPEPSHKSIMNMMNIAKENNGKFVQVDLRKTSTCLITKTNVAIYYEKA